MFDVKGLKVGDKVKIISEGLGRHVGEIGTVENIEAIGNQFLVKVNFGTGWFPYRTDYPGDVIEKVERLKVGDKIILTGEGFPTLKGKHGVVIEDDHGDYLPYRVEVDESDVFCDVNGPYSCIKAPERKKIIIFTVGNEVFAKLIYSDKSFTAASAKCNPSDNFDILVGAQIALQRLAKKLGSKLVLSTEALDAIDIEVKIKDKENFEVV